MESNLKLAKTKIGFSQTWLQYKKLIIGIDKKRGGVNEQIEFCSSSQKIAQKRVGIECVFLFFLFSKIQIYQTELIFDS